MKSAPRTIVSFPEPLFSANSINIVRDSRRRRGRGTDSERGCASNVNAAGYFYKKMKEREREEDGTRQAIDRAQSEEGTSFANATTKARQN